MSVTSIGNGLVTPAELPRDRGTARQAQDQAAQQRAALVKQFKAALPGKSPAENKPSSVHSVVADLEQVGLVFNRRLQFVVDHQSNEVTVKVIDRETDKVIKVLPPEELQRLHSQVKEAIGFLFDQRV